MRLGALLAIAVMLEIPALAAEKVSVAQLEQVVALAQDKPDKDAARRIEALTLSERLARPRFEKLNAELPGQKSREALVVVSDAAAFLDLPAADVSAMAPPSVDEQRAIVLRAVQFAADMAHKMPNFYATRDTTRYQTIELAGEIAVLDEPMKEPPKLELQRTQPFEQVGRSVVTVLYRDGRELIQNKPKIGVSQAYGVENRGDSRHGAEQNQLESLGAGREGSAGSVSLRGAQRRGTLPMELLLHGFERWERPDPKKHCRIQGGDCD